MPSKIRFVMMQRQILQDSKGKVAELYRNLAKQATPLLVRHLPRLLSLYPVYKKNIG